MNRYILSISSFDGCDVHTSVHGLESAATLETIELEFSQLLKSYEEAWTDNLVSEEKFQAELRKLSRIKNNDAAVSKLLKSRVAFSSDRTFYGHIIDMSQFFRSSDYKSSFTFQSLNDYFTTLLP